MPGKTILCLSHSADFYNIGLVCHALTELGYQAVRLNCDNLPAQNQLSYRINSHQRDHFININDTIDNKAKGSQTNVSSEISSKCPQGYVHQLA